MRFPSCLYHVYQVKWKGKNKDERDVAFLQPVILYSWLNHLLFWQYCTRRNDDEKGFPEWFYEKIGLREALEKFPRQNCYAVGDKIGYLTRESAEELGLSEKVFVAQGGVDSSIGILGMGVCGPDRLALMTGSSNLTMLLTKEQMFTENTITAGPNHLLAG